MRTEPGKADRNPAAQRFSDREGRLVADPKPIAIVARREREDLRAVERDRAGRRGGHELDDVEAVAGSPLPEGLGHASHCTRRRLRAPKRSMISRRYDDL